MIYLYVLVFLLVFAYVSWRNFRVALYLIMLFVPTYLLRFSVGGVPTTLLELMIYVAFVMWLARLLTENKRINWDVFRPYIAPVLLLGVGLIIGTWVAPDQSVALGIIKGWFIDPLLLFVMMVSTFDHLLHIKKSIIALTISGLALSGTALYRVVSGNFLTIDGRASAFLDSANYLALYLVPILVLSIGLIGLVQPRWRWWISASAVIMVTALYFTSSYAGWLALIAGLIIWGFLSLRARWPVLAGIGAGLLALASQWQHPKFQQMLDFTGRSSSHVRIQTWQTAFLMIKENIVAGIGLGAFGNRYSEFATRLFQPPLESSVLHPHNVLLHFWVSSGIFGLIGFVWLIGNFFRDVLAAFRHNYLVAGVIVASMVALLMHGMLDGAYFKSDLSILFWVLVAFVIILNHSPKSQT